MDKMCLARHPVGHICIRQPGHLGDHWSAHPKSATFKRWSRSVTMTRQESVTKAAAAGWKKTTKFSHPLKSKIKNLYRNMVKRCHNPKDRRWEDYGGRGIKVCSLWMGNRYKFYEWCLENGISQGLQLDRKDNDGDYSPNNCKFSTAIEQANNTRKNRFIEFDTVRMTVSQWARHFGVNPRAIQHRVSRGWSDERILTQPFRKPR